MMLPEKYLPSPELTPNFIVIFDVRDATGVTGPERSKQSRSLTTGKCLNILAETKTSKYNNSGLSK
jgi:hypothetical protein